MSEDKKGILGIGGKTDPNSIVGKMQAGMGADFLEGIIGKIKPFIDPMLEEISNQLGDDETMVLLRKNVEHNKLYVYIIDTSKVKAFELDKDEPFKQVIDGADFIEQVLSGKLEF